MEHQPQDPELRAQDYEELPLQIRRMRAGEELTDDEIAELVDVMRDVSRHDVLHALSEGTQIDDLGARLIAVLAGAFVDRHSAALDSFIESSSGSPDEIRASYRSIYDRPDISPEVPVLLDFLGTHLANRDRPDAPPAGPVMESARVRFPASPGRDGTWHPLAFAMSTTPHPDDEGPILDRLIDALTIHGDPFRAWLRVPGVDAAAPDLIEQFTRCYHGPVATTADAERLIDHHVVDVSSTLYAFRPDPAQQAEGGQ